MSNIRRFVFREAEYGRVHSWLKKMGKGTHTMPVDYLPKIKWAKRPLKLLAGAHGKEHIAVQEGEQWKRLVHTKEIDGYLRNALLSSKSDVPLSRDGGYHIVQGRTVGISRRALAAFMRKQEVLQITRNRQPIMKQPGRPLEGRAQLPQEEGETCDPGGRQDAM